MKITGYIEINDEVYDTDLLLAFSDFITDDSIEHDKAHLVECLNSRLADDCPDFNLDEESIDKAISDLKKSVKSILNGTD